MSKVLFLANIKELVNYFQYNLFYLFWTKVICDFLTL